MPVISKKEADAHDRMLDAAARLFDLIEGSGIDIDEYAMEELSIFLARNAAVVRTILGRIPRHRAPEKE